MKILILTYASSIEGIANIDIFTPARELIKKGCLIHIVSLKDARPYRIAQGDGYISVFPLFPPVPYMLLLATPILLLRLFRLSRRLRPDILFFDNDIALPVIGFLLSVLTGLPRVILLREAALENLSRDFSPNWLIKLGSKILLWINYLIFSKTRHIVAIAPVTREFYRQSLKRDDIRAINLMCIDTDEFKPDPAAREEWRTRFHISDDGIILMYNGTMAPYRRLDLLIDSFHHIVGEHPNAKLIISGQGRGKPALMQQAKHLGLVDSIIFLDWLPREEVPKLISMADVCIDPFPRKDMTPAGKLLEWMAAGKCIITTRNASHASWIRDKANGLLFTPDNESELTGAIKLLLGQRSLIKSLGENARSSIISDYDVRKIAPVFAEFCQQVVSEHCSGKGREQRRSQCV